MQAEVMANGVQDVEDSAHQQKSPGEINEVTSGDVCHKLLEGTEHDDSPTAKKPEQCTAHHDELDKLPKAEESKTKSKNGATNSNLARWRTKRAAKQLSKLSRKKYALRSSTGTHRVLHPRNQETNKAPESSDNQARRSSTGDRKRKQKETRKGSTTAGDEYSKIKRHLSYLLRRMNYEQSLIVAYSAEGWKGLSLEKLKPEKELQRAKSEIFQRKLSIRDLFRHIDSICAEGRLPEALFDSEGEIDSEDIFCAKCQSKDATLENDIILCDGACDRGFHQFCLVPPLLKEDVPPDSEGWLCPGCDCKDDCIDLLNESQGTRLTVEDSWEKVFPEAALAEGEWLEQVPSDDSDDTSYDPDGPETDQESQEDESSSSDESNFTSTSEEMEIGPGDMQKLGLPSDASDDNDYNPEAPDDDEIVKQESSSSDFSSDSEDLAAVLYDNKMSAEDGTATLSGPQKDFKGGKNCRRGKKNQSLDHELLKLESGPSENGYGSISARRKVERLNYKKLYDETYGNASSDSDDDDEDCSESVGPRRKKDIGTAVLTNGNASPLVEPNTRTLEPVPEILSGDVSRNNAQSMQSTHIATPAAESDNGDAKKTRGRKRKSDDKSLNLAARRKPPQTETRDTRTRRKR